jgi:hypothetical protein
MNVPPVQRTFFFHPYLPMNNELPYQSAQQILVASGLALGIDAFARKVAFNPSTVEAAG